MRVLVDSSVWIQFLSCRLREATELDILLDREQVVGHELVYGEILIGDKGGRKRFLDDYAKMRFAPSIPHSDVVRFVVDRKLHGRGAGWIDLHILASAMVAPPLWSRLRYGRASVTVASVQLWTLDPRMEALAAELGVCYRK
jgi:predicted nucleic acid-binding protein